MIIIQLYRKQKVSFRNFSSPISVDATNLNFVDVWFIIHLKQSWPSHWMINCLFIYGNGCQKGSELHVTNLFFLAQKFPCHIIFLKNLWPGYFLVCKLNDKFVSVIVSLIPTELQTKSNHNLLRESTFQFHHGKCKPWRPSCPKSIDCKFDRLLGFLRFLNLCLPRLVFR